MVFEGGIALTIYDTLDFNLCLNVMLFYLVYLVVQQLVYDYKMKRHPGEEE